MWMKIVHLCCVMQGWGWYLNIILHLTSVKFHHQKIIKCSHPKLLSWWKWLTYKMLGMPATNVTGPYLKLSNFTHLVLHLQWYENISRCYFPAELGEQHQERAFFPPAPQVSTLLEIHDLYHFLHRYDSMEVKNIPAAEDFTPQPFQDSSVRRNNFGELAFILNEQNFRSWHDVKIVFLSWRESRTWSARELQAGFGYIWQCPGELCKVLLQST